MEKTVSHCMKKMYKEELEDSFDTSWLSGSIQTPPLFKPRLDLSQIFAQQSMKSSRPSLSISQSFEDISFFRSEFKTPRVIKASHDVNTSMTSRPATTQSFYRSKPKVITLRKRTIPENLLLDAYPKQ
ncbi:hypothetical protein SteCoe_16356 [Stentor coeruleus]|uniref:Uncharacterized protein n=1 Tax=Stentor coeruleus TaxID=5963 RepID=A0A1R2C1A3_9CILI|nr:hypothetical protein SteCoe_16356 [Stentor coeruleus]